MDTTAPDKADEDAPGPGLMPLLEWDYAAILRALGGANRLRDALQRAGFPVPQERTVWMWRARNRIPHHWMPAVLWTLITMHAVSVESLVRDAEPQPGQPAPWEQD